MKTQLFKRAALAVIGALHHRQARRRGFALVVTVSLLILLTTIALGLLSLSVVTLRSNSQGQAQMQARANARLALQFAIGELQRHAGPDTRVTATADILDADGEDDENTEADRSAGNLAVTGVWKSWEGTDHDSTGRPVKPDYDVKVTGVSEQTPLNNSGRFLSWLVSKPQNVSEVNLISDDTDWSKSAAFTALRQFVSNTPFEGSVPLVSIGSLAPNDARQVHVVPVAVNDGGSQRGSYAWWVGGENQKARLPVPYQPANNDDAAAWSVLAKSHATADPTALELETLLAGDGPAKAARASSLGTASLLVPNDPNAPDPAKQFHDLSAVSVGLLTNTATGGWRKDLTLFTENWDKLPDGVTQTPGAEVFRITPSTPKIMTKPRLPVNETENFRVCIPAGSVFYPWSTYRTPLKPELYGNRPCNYSAAVTSWYNLMSYATLYKDLTLQNGKPTIAARSQGSPRTHPLDPANPADGPFPPNLFNYIHTVRLLPLLGRMQLVYSYRSRIDPSAPDPQKNYKVELGQTTVGTVWNPYNVALEPINHSHHFPRALPPAFQFKIGSNDPGDEWWWVPGDSDGSKDYNDGPERKPPTGTDGNWFEFPKFYTINIPVQDPAKGPWNPLGPGETMVFNQSGSTGFVSPPESTNYNDDATSKYTEIKIKGVNRFGGEEQISPGARFDSFGVPNGVGCYYEYRNQRADYTPGSGNTNISFRATMANRIWPPIAEDALKFPKLRVNEVSNPGGIPFLSLTYGPRLASGGSLRSRGFQQASPFMLNMFAGHGVEYYETLGLQYNYLAAAFRGQRFPGGALGSAHPVNAPLDFNFLTHKSWSEDIMPNVSTDGKYSGYLVTGTQAGNGLSRIAVAELPLRPLGSLAELQHWDVRKDNPAPPNQFYIIGNSDAQPLFAPDAVSRKSNPTPLDPPFEAPAPGMDLQHDDSYCANHLLFDDWFFSTIAPQPTTFGPAGKTLQETFTDFVRTGASLDNRAYRPILEDRGINAAQATDLFNTKVNAAESYRSIASRLEVDGMFNVNSTSVKAWRALLGHARNQRVPYYDNNRNIVLSTATDFATTRTTVASDVAAGDNGSSGTFAEASEYSGYRVFTTEMLDKLAEEMVKQVRKRGPFLSLSEFVNRQLTADDNGLALAGAVQSALNVLAANSDQELNPYSVLKAKSQNAGWSELYDPDPNIDMSAGSRFENFQEASEGESIYGVPGWPRQADILRPLAPILTARDDTFTIRAYGDARDANGNITARATCEAVVRREREFVSPGQDAPDITGPPTAAANQQNGRRFQLVSFRWLHASEI